MTGCSKPDDEDPGAVVQKPRLITREERPIHGQVPEI